MLCFKRTNKRQVTCDIVQQDMWGKTPSERGITPPWAFYPIVKGGVLPLKGVIA